MCKHDEQYRRENESAGGIGCPLCAAESAKYPAGRCPHCGRDLAADVLEYSRDELCADCSELWDRDASVIVSFDDHTSDGERITELIVTRFVAGDPETIERRVTSDEFSAIKRAFSVLFSRGKAITHNMGKSYKALASDISALVTLPA